MTASAAGRRGATARLRSRESRWRICSVSVTRSASTPRAARSRRRRRARTSGDASRKNLKRASGKTTVPMSRPSTTSGVASPMARWASRSTSRTTGTVAMRAASMPTCSVRTSPRMGTPLQHTVEARPLPDRLKVHWRHFSRNSSSGRVSAPGPSLRARQRNMAPVSR